MIMGDPSPSAHHRGGQQPSTGTAHSAWFRGITFRFSFNGWAAHCVEKDWALHVLVAPDVARNPGRMLKDLTCLNRLSRQSPARTPRRLA